jgi:putative transposase
MRLIDPKTGGHIVRKVRARRDEPGDARELTFSCYRHFPFLNSNRTRHWLLAALAAARARWPIDLWAYVIMPEHVHLLVLPKAPGAVSGFLRDLKAPVAREAIAYLEVNRSRSLVRITVREGSRIRRRFWQPGAGYDRNIGTGSTLRAVVNDIHCNPVRRGLAKPCGDWPWSSAA